MQVYLRYPRGVNICFFWHQGVAVYGSESKDYFRQAMATETFEPPETSQVIYAGHSSPATSQMPKD